MFEPVCSAKRALSAFFIFFFWDNSVKSLYCARKIHSTAGVFKKEFKVYFVSVSGANVYKGVLSISDNGWLRVSGSLV